ncbi:MAG: hypothetical protein LUF00_05830 [Lachnospiraceae bacterium]|nr:hypothetical protein [Lachnospiraceae bacterium]
MKWRSMRLGSLLLIILLLLSLTGCGTKESEADQEAEVYHRIGVAVYSTTDPELSLFYDYYRNYIAASFPVEFLLSDDLSTAEDEVAFIEEMKAEGVEGIISFYGEDLESALAACAENEMYYVLGSGSLSDEEYEAVKENPWFLGVIGPDTEEEYDAGAEMAETFVADGATSFLIVTGGAGEAVNFMHYTRVCGMLDTLAEEMGLTYSESVEELAQVTALTEIETGRDDVSIVLSPGYIQMDEGMSNLEQALTEGDYDALMSAVGLSEAMELLSADIRSTEQVLRVGVIDCFSEENREAVETTDGNGNSLLNFVKGKYASMVAPAFVAMFNAVEGDVDVVKPDGVAFRLTQSYWTAVGSEEYLELYSYTQSIYENAYSSVDLMQAIRSYSEDADYERFKELTESCDLESVRERLG